MEKSRDRGILLPFKTVRFLSSRVPDYAYRRSESPIYQILLLNQTDSGEGDFTQSLDDKIRFEVKEGTFFYQYGLSIESS